MGDGQPATLQLGPGQVVGGKYLIERLLGQGGMGAVFVARQERLDRRVAIKVLLPTVASSAEIVARFDREARAAAALQSDHVARVLDVGQLETGTPYMVMELLDGEDLAALLSRRGRLPIDEAVAFVVQACDAISEAHALGIVHRDLKPANLFLARRANGTATVKVLDFGISKTAQSSASVGLTSQSAVIGSPLYMSPEQLTESRSVDRRADIWALGITLYELLAGSPPFSGGSVAEICALVLTTRPPPLLSRRDDMPADLEAVVMRCLRRDPAERFATVEEFVAALRSAAGWGRAAADAHVAPTLVSPGGRSSGPPAPARPVPPTALTADPVSSTQPPTGAPGARVRGSPPNPAVAAEQPSDRRALVAVLAVLGTAAALGGTIALRRAMAGASVATASPASASVASPPTAANVMATTLSSGSPMADADLAPAPEATLVPAPAPTTIATATRPHPAAPGGSSLLRDASSPHPSHNETPPPAPQPQQPSQQPSVASPAPSGDHDPFSLLKPK
jgi:serine/threonine-protein kinase